MSTVEAPASHLPLPMQNILRPVTKPIPRKRNRRSYAKSLMLQRAQRRAGAAFRRTPISHPAGRGRSPCRAWFRRSFGGAAGLLHDTVEDTKVTFRRG